MKGMLDIEAARKELAEGKRPTKWFAKVALDELKAERTKASDLSVALAASGRINKELHERIEELEEQLEFQGRHQ